MFGVITCAGGSVGVIGGSLAASRLRSFTADSDPIVCAFSMLAAAPFVYAGLILPSHNLPATWVGLVYSRFITTTTCISVTITLYVEKEQGPKFKLPSSSGVTLKSGSGVVRRSRSLKMVPIDMS